MKILPIDNKNNRQNFEKGKVMVRQQIFNRTLEFVAVKYLKLTEKDSLKPGDPIDKSVFKGFHIRSLYRRRIIGVKGSLWAKSMIAATKANSQLKPEIVGEIKTKSTGEVVTSKSKADKPKLKSKVNIKNEPAS